MPKKEQPSRATVLEDCLKPLAARVTKDDLRTAVYATIDAFKPSSGITYTDFEAMLHRLYPEPVPVECDICGRLICDGHIGEGFQ